MDTIQTLKQCTDILEKSKAHDLVDIDVSGSSSIADTMLLCTGTSSRHVSAIALRLYDDLKKLGYKGITISGEQNGEWVIVDTGSVMVHVMQPEVRERYELDDLYRCMAAAEV